MINESKQTLRVLQIIDDASIGGGQIHVLLLSKYLLSMDIKVTIATASVGWLVEQANILDIPVCPIDISNKITWRAFESIHRLLKIQDFDVIHTHGGTAGFWGRLVAKILQHKSKIIHSYHGLHYLNIFQNRQMRQRLKNILFKTIDQLTLNVTDHIICVCLSDYEKAITANVASPSKTSIVNYGIDIVKFSQPINKEISRKIFDIAPTEFIFGNVGRLHEQKGHQYLLKAFAKVSDRARLLIIGDGDLKDELIKLADDLQISDRITFLGARSDVHEFLSAIDVFVMPSLWEGQPIALLEALAMGKPCIVSDVDGISEVITNNVNGYLVKPKDIAGLTQAMNQSIDNPEVLKQLANSGVNTITEKFLAQNMAKAIADIYLTQII
ncbi:glycosyltransferase family 4 protein [Pseudanabaena sp. FACHB-1277]|uniref:Glycosyltransferase family 4 protein n=1 Tax=Pseudanabaena cinerea FACHB-1277 TaxID=2949581 RepID=A0A926Z5C1_9CYAN|nr:glycosyltransferase family 4 protein [Pseudanabaena cinerea]MBD2150111.1 glycosyltransferase family 4 protein [Pseudanabaena cinerea FACHB-1277]